MYLHWQGFGLQPSVIYDDLKHSFLIGLIHLTKYCNLKDNVRLWGRVYKGESVMGLSSGSLAQTCIISNKQMTP